MECRADPDCVERYDDEKRIPSFCDRILATTDPNKQAWTLKEYSSVKHSTTLSDANSGVFQSDHDVVYAIAESGPYRMIIVTFNCEAQSTPSSGSWTDFLAMIERHCGDLAGFSAINVCLQEAGGRNSMARDLTAHLGSAFDVHVAASSTTMLPNFQVVCMVALKKDDFSDAAVVKRMQCFGNLSFMVCSKSAVSVHVTSNGPAPPFVAISAHLPINTKDKPKYGGTYGFPLRVAALTLTVKRFIDKPKYADTWAFIAGDLNFRCHKSAGDDDELGASGLLHTLGLQEMPIEFKPTCKLRTIAWEQNDSDGEAPTVDLRSAGLEDEIEYAPSDDSDEIKDIVNDLEEMMHRNDNTTDIPGDAEQRGGGSVRSGWAHASLALVVVVMSILSSMTL